MKKDFVVSVYTQEYIFSFLHEYHLMICEQKSKSADKLFCLQIIYIYIYLRKNINLDELQKKYNYYKLYNIKKLNYFTKNYYFLTDM